MLQIGPKGSCCCFNKPHRAVCRNGEGRQITECVRPVNVHTSADHAPTWMLPSDIACSTACAQKIWLTASTTMAGQSRTHDVRGRFE